MYNLYASETEFEDAHTVGHWMLIRDTYYYKNYEKCKRFFKKRILPTLPQTVYQEEWLLYKVLI